jgi:phospholipid/cholesterol/gamma-HCH transport system substrate-binding protein
MADPKKVHWSQLKVGLLGLAACLIAAMLIFLLTSSRGIFQRKATLRTYMDDASGIAESTPVRLNGITIGALDKVRLTNSTNPKRTVEFDMEVQEKYLSQIPIDSMAGVGAANLLGDKFINITKGADIAHTVKDGDELQSIQTQDIPELMDQSAKLLKSFQTIFGRIDNLLAGVEQGKGNIGKLLKDEELYNRLNGITNEAQGLLKDVRGGRGTLSKLLYSDELYQELRAPLKRIDTMLADLQSGQGTAGKLLKDPALFDEFQATMKEVKSLVADLNAGKGTAGKLLKDETIHKRLDELVAKLNSTVDKINSGQGTVGQLLVNPQMYEALTGATREFQTLAKDMRANPKRFLTIRLTLF